METRCTYDSLFYCISFLPKSIRTEYLGNMDFLLVLSPEVLPGPPPPVWGVWPPGDVVQEVGVGVVVKWGGNAPVGGTPRGHHGGGLKGEKRYEMPEQKDACYMVLVSYIRPQIH